MKDVYDKKLEILEERNEEAIGRINKAKRAILPKEVKKFNVEHVQMAWNAFILLFWEDVCMESE